MTSKRPKQDTKDRILKAYAKLAEKHRVHPTTSALVREKITRNMVRHHFGSISKLHEVAKVTFPDVFESLNNDNLFSPERLKQVKEAIAGAKRFFLTTAVTGQRAHNGFLASIRNYCKLNDAKLLILTATDPASNCDEPPLDEELANEHIIGEDVALNRNIFISSIKLSAKHIDPVTGLERIGQRGGSFVYASPKQRLKLVATSASELPCALMTTGACTVASYSPTPGMPHAYMSQRTAYLADNDHVVGGIIVELDGPKKFHFRQVQSDKEGRFADLGKLYSGTNVIEFPPEALSLGDLHAQEVDEEVIAAKIFNSDSVVAVTKPRIIILHDTYDGNSINHHEEKNITIRARLAEQNRLSLSDEIKHCADLISRIAAKFEETYLSKSNHDEFAQRYLDSGGYLKDPQNTVIGLRMHAAALEGLDPLEWALRQHIPSDVGRTITFLQRDEDFKVGGFEAGAHGDKGANGAKGSTVGMEKAFGASVSGHVHTPEILRKTIRNGTCSKRKMRYNVGPSSWLNTSTLIYPNGMFQLITVIDGKWRA